MTETIDAPVEGAASNGAPKKSGGLGSMLLPELRQIAGGLGIKTTGMKKAELVSAIKAAQGGGSRPRQDAGSSNNDAERTERSERSEAPEGRAPREEAPQEGNEQREGGQRQRQRNNQGGNQNQGNQGGQNRSNGGNNSGNNGGGQNNNYGDDGGSRRNRRRRGRDRDRGPGGGGGGGQQGGRGNRNEPDLNVLEDDVLAPCAGILDIHDNYAFVRTSGYLPGSDDVYVAMSMVRKFGLRRGDAVMGQVRQPREGERKEKFNPLVRLDSVNGAEPEASKDRADFNKL
ncbi:MAG: Rho termination factor N-terminal domain-containing protein, partial [Marmoricola sp.]